MSRLSSPSQGKGKEPVRDIIFQVSRSPDANHDLNDIDLEPMRREPSANSIASDHFQSIAALPTLSYSRPTHKRQPSSLALNIGTEYRPPASRGSDSGGNTRVRGHYVSLDDAIADDSQPDFNPERLYAREANNSSSTTLNDPTSPYRNSKLSPDSNGGRYPSGYGTYPPTPDYGLKSGETDFLKTPSPSLFPHGLPKPPKQHPFSQWFEAPKWKTLALHTVLCLATYPFLLIFVVIAKDRTLFWARVAVGVGCGIAGVSLGMSLIRLARSHLEAAAWATVIHQSKYQDHPGVKLKDIAPLAEDPVSAYNGLGLLWNRHTYPGTARKNRMHYDPRFWSIHILLFLILVAVAGLLPFIFGRLVDIETVVNSQRENYYDIAMKGAISDADLAGAHNLTAAFDSDATPSLENNSSETVNTLQAGFSPGNIVRQPRWGIRIKCEKIPDAQNNILPISTNLSMTYVFIPKETIGTLLNYFGKPFPTNYPPPALLTGDQPWPSNVNQSDILRAAAFWNNGVNHNYFSNPLYNMGTDGTGFVSMEVVLIRLNTTFAAQGQFPVLGQPIPDINGTATYIGYDAAVCIEVFEPWIVEVYNNTAGAPTTLRIVEKNNVVQDSNTGGIKEKRMGSAINSANVTQALSSKGLQDVYLVAHQNSINQMLKDNGRDSFYVPSTLAISYTSGSGPYGYTSLSAPLFAQAKALADANNILPYFAGTGDLLARVYPDRVVAYASILPLYMIITLVALFFLGLIAALCVPRLPMNVPRRGFELYSWVAAFYADELVGTGKGGALPGQSGPGQAGLPIGRRMELEDIEQHIGDVRFRYVS
ncbi:hypothetical protein NP233_g3915 [Leucocoprinus birnbaumii]|uniref:Uncharacterized protein n=1 Tax=Leucocoprinus birnbaumii TaxID=56174 RepID=A0AAD5VVL9_9AGAR|nr:hypothetical protein NP233_g3915 [Leucocoprinus birnbaumii]